MGRGSTLLGQEGVSSQTHEVGVQVVRPASPPPSPFTASSLAPVTFSHAPPHSTECP